MIDRRSRHALIVVAALGVAALGVAAGPAAAELQEGDTCEARQSVDVKVRSNRGQVTLPIDKGDPIEVLNIFGDQARVRSGEMTGVARLSDLEEACRPAARKCQLKAPVTIEQVPDGSGRRWKIKTGGVLTVTEKLPAFSRVTIGPVEGYVPTDELASICIPIGGQAPDTKPLGDGDDDTAPATTAKTTPRKPVAFPPVMAGKSVVVAPLCISDKADGDMAALLETQLAATLDQRRTDISPPGADRPLNRSRKTELKTHLKDLVPGAEAAGINYVITGRLKRIVETRELTEEEIERQELEERLDTPDDEREKLETTTTRDVLQVVVFDIEKRRVTRSVLIEPSLNKNSNWAEEVSAALDRALPSAGLRASASTDVSTDNLEEGETGTLTADGGGWIQAEEPLSVMVWIGSGVLGGAAAALVVGAAIGGASLALGYLSSTAAQNDPNRPLLAMGALGTGAGADVLFFATGGLVLVGGFLLVAGLVTE